MPANMENSEVAIGLEKVHIYANPKEGQWQRMFKLVLEKAEEPEIKLPISAGSSKKEESSRKTSLSALLTTPKHLCGLQLTINCGQFLKRWEHRTTLPDSRQICVQVKKQQLELGMEEWTDSKLGKE